MYVREKHKCVPIIIHLSLCTPHTANVSHRTAQPNIHIIYHHHLNPHNTPFSISHSNWNRIVTYRTLKLEENFWKWKTNGVWSHMCYLCNNTKERVYHCVCVIFHISFSHQEMIVRYFIFYFSNEVHSLALSLSLVLFPNFSQRS